MRNRPDDGTVLLLVLGLVVIAALLVMVVIDVSELFLARRGLLAAADGAALAGAQAVDEEAVYRDGVHGSLPLDRQRVRSAVDEYLASSGLTDTVGDLQVQVTSDTNTVHVELVGVVRLPVVNAVTPAAVGGVEVAASASARSAVLP
ncbi:MAG: pilus assembly protein TadG-related protein [Actinomycetes bacterium]